LKNNKMSAEIISNDPSKDISNEMDTVETVGMEMEGVPFDDEAEAIMLESLLGGEKVSCATLSVPLEPTGSKR
jgi:hypothetical protein